jgi:predicted PolB exonuclease-like 3'-5' exonuclease
MLNNINTEKILFLDIETVPMQYSFSELDDRSKELWNKKTTFLQKRDEKSAEEIYNMAGIYAEFGKIICVSVGFISQINGEEQIRLKSFASENEKVLLQEFIDLLDSKFNNESFLLCAHNGKEFDYPLLSRRMLINGLKLPLLLDIAGKKPWEIRHLDTMELWKFGDYKNYTSLDLLTHIFNIPTSKDDIDGSQVARVYYEDKDLERIIIYCEKDVIATIQLFRRYKGQDIIDDNFIKSV